MERFDPFILLYCIEAVTHVARMPNVPKITSTVVIATSLLHFIQRRTNLANSILSIYDYGLLPEFTFKRRFITSSMLISPFLHTSITQLLTHMLPFLISACTLENVLNSKITFLTLLSYSVVVPNTLLVVLTKCSSVLPWTIQSRSRFRPRGSRSNYQKLHYGFSSVLFCVHTILNLAVYAPSGSNVYMYGFSIPAKWSHWIELILHQYLMPSNGSSVFSRLAGILSGYFYLYLWNHANPFWKSLLNGSGARRIKTLLYIWYRYVKTRSIVVWHRISGRGGNRIGSGGGRSGNNIHQHQHTTTDQVHEIEPLDISSPNNVQELRRRRLLRFTSDRR